MIFFAAYLSPGTAAVYADEGTDPADADETVISEETGPDLPAVYDPRPDGVSQIRNQYWGTCWAQAGIAAAEMFLIHNGLEDSSYQLSVEDALWRSRYEGDGG